LTLLAIHPDSSNLKNFAHYYIQTNTAPELSPPLSVGAQESELTRFFFKDSKKFQTPEIKNHTLGIQEFLISSNYHQYLMKLKKEKKPYVPTAPSRAMAKNYSKFFHVEEFFKIWEPLILNQYGILHFTSDQKCDGIKKISLNLGQDSRCGFCYKAGNLDRDIESIGNKVSSQDIIFSREFGIDRIKTDVGCLLLTEINNNSGREHFLEGEIPPGPGGFASFSVNLKNLKMQNGAFFIQTGNETLYVLLQTKDPWHIGSTNNLQLLWKQTRCKQDGSEATFKFLIKKPRNQKMLIRWQNMKGPSTTMYKGSSQNTLLLCSATYSEYENKKK
jgi:hypothetical protein